MDITIKTVPAIDTQAWPNEIAVGYLTGWMRRYDAILPSNTLRRPSCSPI